MFGWFVLSMHCCVCLSCENAGIVWISETVSGRFITVSYDVK